MFHRVACSHLLKTSYFWNLFDQHVLGLNRLLSLATLIPHPPGFSPDILMLFGFSTAFVFFFRAGAYPIQRWSERPSTTTGNASSSKGPWDDVEQAWGRGGYIERAIDRDCGSYLPAETLSFANDLDIDHLGKETLTTAMRRNPKRWAGTTAVFFSELL